MNSADLLKRSSLLMAAVLLVETAQAATASFNSTAPTLGPDDIGNLTGAAVGSFNRHGADS